MVPAQLVQGLQCCCGLDCMAQIHAARQLQSAQPCKLSQAAPPWTVTCTAMAKFPSRFSWSVLQHQPSATCQSATAHSTHPAASAAIAQHANQGSCFAKPPALLAGVSVGAGLLWLADAPWPTAMSGLVAEAGASGVLTALPPPTAVPGSVGGCGVAGVPTALPPPTAGVSVLLLFCCCSDLWGC
jgi:hypothetical protein